MATITSIQSAACTSGIGKVTSPIQLLQLIGQLQTTRSSGPTPPVSTLLNGLTAYWDLDEVSGDSFESVTAAFSMISVAAVGSNTGPGGVGTARSFNGSTQYMRAANSTAYTPFPMTLNFWVLSTVATNTNFIAKDDFENGQRDYEILSTGTTMQQYFFADIFTTLNEQPYLADISEWIMFTVVYEDSLLSLYADGSPIGSTPTSPGGTFVPGTNSLSFAARYRASSGDFDGPLNGRMAKAGIWNRVLTSSEITQLYNAGVGLLYSEL